MGEPNSRAYEFPATGQKQIKQNNLYKNELSYLRQIKFNSAHI